MRQLLIGLGVQPAAAREVAADLAFRYAEPHRRYHTAEHIAEVLAEADRLLGCFSLSADDAAAVLLAVWFHDAIYEPTRGAGANEDASAELAEINLRRIGLAERLASEVARLVRLTADHAVDSTDRSGAVLVDADLAILASSPERYDRYARDVRSEYIGVDDHAWRAGRAVVLRRFLDVDQLYRTGPDRTQRDQMAKANLERELPSLTPPAHSDAAASVDDAGPSPATGGPARAD